MKDFAALYDALDRTNRTNDKVDLLAGFFASQVPAVTKIRTLFLLSGHHPRRPVSSTLLRTWGAQRSGLPDWLVEECHQSVGDLAETLSLLLPPPSRPLSLPLEHWLRFILGLPKFDEANRRQALFDAWDTVPQAERFCFNKLLTGGFRVGISRTLIIRALAQANGLSTDLLSHRLMGLKSPDQTTWEDLLRPDSPHDSSFRPYPFFLAHPLEQEPSLLGDPAGWLAEWKWDGIRCQLVVRGGTMHLWSRGEELLTDRFPEFAPLSNLLPSGTVLDGELLCHRDGTPAGFDVLQTRITRKTLSRKMLAESPALFMAYDLLEQDGQDLRPLPLHERRRRLQALVAATACPLLRLSEPVPFGSWAESAARRATARAHLAEGLMLKRLDSPYETGRRKGGWWKWKVDPFSVDAVLVYAQKGHGRRADLFTDYTFAVWDTDRLVPFAKAYSGLTDAEIRRVDAFIRKHTVEKFGPVRTVTPELVFEIGFEGIRPSARHKSGVAVRFPRILRWRTDKKPADADTLDRLRALLHASPGADASPSLSTFPPSVRAPTIPE